MSAEINQNKRIFITGGASGLGKAIAVKYASEGYNVCIADINEKRGHGTIKELEQLTADAFYLSCDITEIAALEAAKNTLVERWGGVDIVVNNAGVGGTAGAIEDISLDDWEWVLDINLMGVVRGSKVFTPLFKQQKSGHFINIASVAGLINPPRMSNYNVSKAAVISLSETLRLELAPFQIGVSVACPAFFMTNLTESIKSTVDGVTEQVEKIMQRSRINADDIANDVYTAVEENNFWILSHKTERRLWLLKRYLPVLFNSIMKKQTQRIVSKR